MDEMAFKKFNKRVNAILEVLKINDTEAYEDLMSRMSFWAPEIRLENLINWINDRYSLNPEDSLTLTIYSLLMDRPILEVKKKMEESLNIDNEERHGKHFK